MRGQPSDVGGTRRIFDGVQYGVGLATAFVVSTDAHRVQKERGRHRGHRTLGPYSLRVGVPQLNHAQSTGLPDPRCAEDRGREVRRGGADPPAGAPRRHGSGWVEMDSRQRCNVTCCGGIDHRCGRRTHGLVHRLEVGSAVW